MTTALLRHPKDVCVCGDYRDQHDPNDGACKFNVAKCNVGHGGPPDCEAFRLDHRHQQSTTGSR